MFSRSINICLSPRLVKVNVFGEIKNPGIFNIPQGSSLGDLIDLTGPVKPLAGRVVLIRFTSDGDLEKRKIRYSKSAKAGSKKNPFIKDGDYVSVRESFFGKSAGIISEVTRPFAGIYGTVELIEKF